MENTSLSRDAWDSITTTTSPESDDVTNNLMTVRDLVLKVIYIVIGTLGVVDNLAVLIIFILFIKITDKVSV